MQNLAATAAKPVQPTVSIFSKVSFLTDFFAKYKDHEWLYDMQTMQSAPHRGGLSSLCLG